MPFVEILWKRDQLTEEKLVSLRDALPQIVASELTRVDPAHEVEPSMVDVRVITSSSYDRINPALYVTILARVEPARDEARQKLVEAITHALQALKLPSETMVELILTNRSSTYRYHA